MAGQPSQTGETQPGDSGSPRQREQTEEGPGEGTKPEEGEGPDKKPTNGEQPMGGEETDDEGENREGRIPPTETDQPPAPGTEVDRWGDLPPRAQEIFRNQGRDDVPMLYRDWIDSYYRRLNAPPGTTGTGR